MILCEQYDAVSGEIITVSQEQLATSLHEPNAIFWVDVQHPSDEDFTWLTETFNFHPLAIEDARKQKQRAKVDRYENHYFLALHAIHYYPHSHRVGVLEIGLFLGKNFIVTVHQKPIPSITDVRKRWEQLKLPGEATPFLFYLIIDAVVDSYFPAVDLIGNQIDEVDTTIFEKMDQSSLRTIFELRRSLLTIRKLLTPLRDALNELIRAEEGGFLFTAAYTRTYLGDVFDHVLRLTDFVDTYRDMLAGSLEAYQSSQANNLNTNMQRLTVAAIILATSTVLTGFYGMNLQGLMINSPWPYGGHLILGILVVVTLIELWIFRRIRWI